MTDMRQAVAANEQAIMSAQQKEVNAAYFDL